MRHLFVIVFLLTFVADCLADGKMYVQLDRVPPTIPYQRALILFNDGQQTLILQSKYEAAQVDDRWEMGWVVPLPAEPELASMSSRAAWSLFFHLSLRTRPHVVDMGRLIVPAVVLVFLGGILYRFVRSTPKQSVPARLIIPLVVIFVAALLIGAMLPTLGGSTGVKVIDSRRVGVYDVRVVRSGDAEALIAWLNDNAFKFTDEDRTVFDGYIDRGWCFVVAKLAPDAEQQDEALGIEGLTAPLIMRFASESPIYPVALTATGGHATEMLIYVATDAAMSCDQRLPLRYAGQPSGPLSEIVPEAIEPAGVFSEADRTYAWLSKFRGTMTPQQMAQDITFTPAANQAAHRERVYRWW